MAELGRADLRGALALVETLAADRGTDPFPLPVLAQLQELAEADTAAAYVESEVVQRGPAMCYELVTRPQPEWLRPTLERVGAQDPIHELHCSNATAPVAISDRMTAGEFHRLELYRLVCEPLGTADSIRLYLPAPKGTARYFFFDRSRYGFPARTRLLRELLRPHLAHARARFDERLVVRGDGTLSPREIEIMHRVAQGAGNAEIARQLWVSEHTVRKHLENIYAKLGVHSRTAAVATLRNAPDKSGLPRSHSR
jgi:DNA-binding CsgD family transcriptional regulator